MGASPMHSRRPAAFPHRTLHRAAGAANCMGEAPMPREGADPRGKKCVCFHARPGMTWAMPIEFRRRAAFAFLVVTIVLAAVALPAYAADPNEFAVWSTTNLPGRLYVPADYDPAVAYPFILFFHGFGERGTNNVAQVDGNIDGLLAAAKQRGAFLYAPQSSGGNWGSTEIGRASCRERV